MTMNNAASSSSNNNSANNKSSLSSAVSSLVRAQYGLNTNKTASSNNTTTTTDLDKHVAELLLQEARDREARSKASASVNSWTFSDEEDGDGKTYTSRTNKRFLKNMLKGVEEHNAPLRRKEERKESLDEIRKREREAREKRTGVKDSERVHHRASASTSGPAAATATAPTATSTTMNGEDKARRATAPPPGFAARTLAMGLSGAISARETQHREERDKKTAIIDARRRAGESSNYRDEEPSRREASKETDSVRYRISSKGKERQRHSDIEEEDAGESSRRRRNRSRSKDRESRESHRSSRPMESKAYESSEEAHHRKRRHRDTDRERSNRRSRSPDRVRSDKNGRETAHSRRDEPSTRSTQDRERQDVSERERSRSYEEEDTSKKRSRRRRRSASSDDIRSLSDHASEASSDTFIDYTGAADEAARVLAGSSKMDKYFSTNYNPALDISIADLEDPKTGLIGEANFSEWDKMLHTLQKRKEDKTFGVTKAREEERERLLRKEEKRRRREEREVRHALRKEEKKSKHKKKKHRRHHSESGSSGSDSSVGPKPKQKSHKHGTSASDTVVIDGFEYGKRGAVRAWDLGK